MRPLICVLEEDATVLVLLLQVALGSLAFLLSKLAKGVAPCSPDPAVAVREEAGRGPQHSQVDRASTPWNPSYERQRGGGGGGMVGRLSGS